MVNRSSEAESEMTFNPLPSLLLFDFHKPFVFTQRRHLIQRVRGLRPPFSLFLKRGIAVLSDCSPSLFPPQASAYYRCPCLLTFTQPLAANRGNCVSMLPGSAQCWLGRLDKWCSVILSDVNGWIIWPETGLCHQGAANTHHAPSVDCWSLMNSALRQLLMNHLNKNSPF